jgi:RHS repeat-associated protein
MKRVVAFLAIVLMSSIASAQVKDNYARGFHPEKLYQFGNLDSINLFNGNLTVALPFGKVQVSSSLSYDLTLAYNSNAWEYTDVEVERPTAHPSPGPAEYNPTVGWQFPTRKSNAGLGWSLSLGRLINYTIYGNPGETSVYESPDGADHESGWDDLSATPTTYPTGGYYTDNGSYVRFLTGTHELDTPDGLKRTFNSDGTVKKIADQSGNWVLVTSGVDSTGTTLTITDSAVTGRVSIIHTKSMSGSSSISHKDPPGAAVSQLNYKNVIDWVQVPGPNGALTYTLHYDDQNGTAYSPTTLTPCGTEVLSTDTAYPRSFLVPMLTKIDLPDGTSFGASYEAAAPNGCSDKGLAKLTLPTGGAIKWTYIGYYFSPQFCFTHNWVNRSIGVQTRTFVGASDQTLGTWTYAHTVDTTSSYNEVKTCDYFSDDNVDRDPTITYETSDSPNVNIHWRPHVMTVVTAPSGRKDIYHFTGSQTSSTASLVDPEEYGSPQFRLIADSTGSRYLSVETFDCSSGTCPSTADQTKYIRYITSGTSFVPNTRKIADVIDKVNPRTESELTLFREGTSLTIDRSDYDDYGHYRKAVTTATNATGISTFAASRTTYTNYNRSSKTSTTNAAIAITDPWVVTTYPYSYVEENGQRVTTEACFDATTAFLVGLRTLSSGTAFSLGTAPTESGNDLLLVMDHDTAGNINRERYFGGDVTGLGSVSGCGTIPTSTADYDIHYGWTSGILASKQYYSGTNAMSFLSIDRTVGSAGQVTSERDTAGIEAAYTFDTSGRMHTITPTGDAASSIDYTTYSSSGPAAVQVTQSDTTVATKFDDLGRIVQETRVMPDGNKAMRETVYDAAGRKHTLSEWEQVTGTESSFHPTHVTTYAYDGFDRPATVTAPDGTKTIYTYTGAAEVDRTTATAAGVTEPSNAVTKEFYDAFGRLVSVVENSGTSSAPVTTSYSYDAGDRLKQMTSSAGTQTRTFTYDNRGLLTSEQHPEKATMTYPEYDARGHARRVVTGTGNTFDLKFTYDAAERLWKVQDLDPTDSSHTTRRDLQVLSYSSAANCTPPSATCDASNGKLSSAIRHNYGTLGDIQVTSSYMYQGRSGRPSQLETATSTLSTFTGRTFTVKQEYNVLGSASKITYPSCISTGCTNGSATLTDLSLSYTKGLLTAVGTPASSGAYASSIAYQPNGTLATVSHANNLVETWTADDNGMARPKSISASGAGASWSTGNYTYDAAGNIAAIGTKSFGYDGVNRLTSYTDAGVTAGYAYDAFGNQTQRTFKMRAGDHFTNMSVVIPVDAATNHLNAWRSGGLAASTYDDAGNQLHWTTTDPDDYKSRWSTSTWAALGAMTSLTTANGSTTYYIYDADDERLGTVVRPAATSQNTIRWTVRGLGHELLRTFTDTNGSWSWTDDNIFRDGKLLANLSSTGTKHFALDHLGSPRVVTGPLSTNVAYENFAPFGEGGVTGAGALQFTGHERDWSPAGGSDPIDYMHARYYSPSIGRFLSVDPIVPSAAVHEPQRWNRYAYVSNNPMRNTDPTGKLLEARAGACSDQQANCYTRLQSFNALQSWVGKDAAKYLHLGKNGQVTLKGISASAFAKFGSAAGTVANLVRSTDRTAAFALSSDAKGGAYTDNIAGGTLTKINPASLPNFKGGVAQTLDTAMAHELGGHALMDMWGISASDKRFGSIDQNITLSTVPASEGFAITMENQYRAEQGLDLRTYYNYKYDYDPPKPPQP